nr:hypothetical protein [Tanacetum cinerariifolium]
MSDASSAVTYTSVYTDSEPCRYYGEESAEAGSLGVIVYGYDGLLMQPIAPPSPDYVLRPEHPPSPDYVPGPEHPPLPIEIPYVPELEYPKYLAPSNNEATLEDQPLPADASTTAASPGYPFDDDDDDDDDTDDEDMELFEDKEDDEEEEHLALADSFAVPITDPDLSAGDTEALEADEPTPTPISPHNIIPLSQTCLYGLHYYPRCRIQGRGEFRSWCCKRTNEFEIRFEEAQDDRALLRDRVNTLFIDKPDHCHTAMLLDRETIYTRKAWAGSKDRSEAIVAHVRTLEAQVAALIAQTSSL